MKVVCAWCQRQGRLAVLGDKESQQEGVSHGICDDHALLLLAAARQVQARARQAQASVTGSQPSAARSG
jgi:hypothetical protein